jgi:hypothetical protein
MTVTGIFNHKGSGCAPALFFASHRALEKLTSTFALCILGPVKPNTDDDFSSAKSPQRNGDTERDREKLKKNYYPLVQYLR